MRIRNIALVLFATGILIGFLFLSFGLAVDGKDSSTEAANAKNLICPVSGQEIGSMGPAVHYEYNGKVYNLCCSGCVEVFKENPQEYSDITEQEAM